MKIIPRYILKHFLPIFGLALGAFVGLYLIIDFFEKVDQMLEKRVLFSKIMLYFFYKAPFIVNQGIPMASLLGAIISVSILKRNREIVALESAGVSPAYYVKPIVLAALVISGVHFLTNETVTNSMNHKAQQLWQQEVQKRQVSWNTENIWYRSKDAIYQIRLYDGKNKRLERVTVFYLDPQFRATGRLDARRFTWEGKGWTAEDGLLLRFGDSGVHEERFAEKRLDIPETPKDFSGLETIPEELGWLSLYRYTEKIRLEGYNTVPYEVDLQMRIAFPLTTLILALLGTTIALRQGLHGGIAVGVGISLLVAFLYVTVLHVGSALATAGILSPFVGVWAADVVFFALTGYLWMLET